MPADPVGELRTNKPLELAGGWTSNAEAAPIAPQNTVNASPRRIIAPARASFRRRAVTETALLDGRRYTYQSYGSVMDLPGGRKGYRADADAVAKQPAELSSSAMEPRHDGSSRSVHDRRDLLVT